MPSFEVLLPLGAIGLYLFDSTLLLYANEVMFLHRGGRWHFVLSSSIFVAGRRLWFANPLTPAIAQFRVRWSEADTRQDQESDDELAAFLAALRPLQYLVAALWLLLAMLPVDLFVFGTGPELLALMAAFYLVALLALGYIFARRGPLCVSGRAFAALAFDSLACAPFAINLVRKLAMRRGLAGNPLEFAQRKFDPNTFATLVGAVCARVGEEQVRELGQSPRWAELESYRRKLTALLSRQG